MKLLVFSPYYPPHVGGLESHSEEFNRYLSEQGIDITVFTPRIPRDAPEKEISHSHIDIIRFPALEVVPNFPLPKFWSPRFWSHISEVKKRDYDFIISRTRFFLTSFIALLFARFTKTKHIHIEHGSDFVKLSSFLKTIVAKGYDYTLGWLVLRYSDMNVSVSRAVQQFILKFDKRPSPIIYRGYDFTAIDAVREDQTLREKYSGKTLLVTAARLYRWKGIDCTIQALHLLPREIREQIVFLIVGDGEDFTRLKQLSTGLPVEFCGILPREKVFSILKASDIYLHSSLPGGGLSTSLIEALACGCAVIASPHEGVDEVVENGKNGILLRNFSPSHLATAITNLVSDTALRSQLSLQAPSSVRKRFSWNISIGKYLEVFRTV